MARLLARGFQVLRAAWRHLAVPALRRRPVPARAERVQSALEELGGTWIKLGQALALRFDLLPADYCLQFFRLLNRVSPFPSESVREIVERELGGRVEDLFRDFDWTPIAAASIGQVHRATLPDGSRVAVKVQRPGIRELVHADLRWMRLLAALADAAGLFGRMRARDLVVELARWTEEELDYRIEARHAAVLRRNADEDPFERNPRVFREYTTRAVLTLEYLPGIPVIDVIEGLRSGDAAFAERLRAEGHDRKRIASRIVWNALNQIYRFGYFHADPHPANVIVLAGDAIGYVDFGIVGKLDGRTTDSLRHFAQSLFAGRTADAVDEFMRFLTPSARTDVAAARRDLVEAMNDYVESSRVGPEGDALFEDVFEIEMLEVVRAHAMTLAPEAVRYLKAVLTAEAMVKELDPDFDLRAHENRFFGRLMEIEAIESLRPRRVAERLLDASFRLRKLLDSIDRAEETPQRLVEIARSVRARVQFFSGLTMLGWIAVVAVTWAARTARGTPMFGYPTRLLAFAGAIASFVFLISSIFQARRLPSEIDAETLRRFPRRLR